jgi:hypothetical protein
LVEPGNPIPGAEIGISTPFRLAYRYCIYTIFFTTPLIKKPIDIRLLVRKGCLYALSWSKIRPDIRTRCVINSGRKWSTLGWTNRIYELALRRIGIWIKGGRRTLCEGIVAASASVWLLGQVRSLLSRS